VITINEKIVTHIHSESYLQQYAMARIDHQSLVFRTNRPAESLNGYWYFTVDPYDTGLRANWPQERDQAYWQKDTPWDYGWDEGDLTPVPSCWNTVHPEYYYYEGSAWYARRVSYRPQRPGERVFLRIGAANYDTKIFLNGVYLGCHQGGSTPFCLELTAHLKEDNLLQICVNNERSIQRLPGRNTDWFNYGGLYRDVELLRLPPNFIQQVAIYLVPDGSFSTIKAEVEVNQAMQGVAEEIVTLSIPELNISVKSPVIEGRAEFTVEGQPELWSPENPKLYQCVITYQEDTIQDRVGFRQIETRGTELLLNGKPLFLRGISVHEDDWELGKATTEERIRQMFADALELGCNYVRLAHYPHSELAAQIADELGILLWEELPVYWTVDFANPETYQDAENQLLELIKRDFNRASVIIWSIGNENADTEDRFQFMSNLFRAAKKQDPARLVAAACIVEQDRLAQVLDVIGINEYYGWYNPDYAGLVKLLKEWRPGKPVVISETGAGALAGYHGPVTEMFTEEYMARVYQQQIEITRNIDYIRGFSPWILYDFRSPRRQNRFQQGYNRKGLIAEDKRTRKLAFGVLQEYYRRRAAEGLSRSPAD
jgi:beta-glucuronidase